MHGGSGAVGSELVRRLGAMGARVGVVVRRSWQVAHVEQALEDAGVPRARHLVGVVDGADSEAASGFVKGVEDSLGPLAAMISVVGAFASAPFGEERTDVAERLWQANFAAPVCMARAVASPMCRRRSGTLVFTGARLVMEPAPPSSLALYVASKAALHALVTSVAADLLSQGVRVALLAPGTIDTSANRRAMPDADRSNWAPLEAVVDELLRLANEPPESPIVVAPARGPIRGQP